MALDPRSEAKLREVHPDLARVVRAAALICPLQFIVTEGLRTRARQEKLVAAGASKTMNSRHLTGHAVDLAPTVDGVVRWDWPLFHTLAAAMKSAAEAEDVPLVWGGDWTSFKDGPHFELLRKVYPAS
jgi:peptidoglycan LD-endopeptidase CwlK